MQHVKNKLNGREISTEVDGHGYRIDGTDMAKGGKNGKINLCQVIANV